MKIRAAKLAIATLACTLAVAVSSATATADEGWVIKSFQSTIRVNTDSTIAVVEDIRVDFGGLQKHGIFRTIPVRYQYTDRQDRYYNLDIKSVTDGTSPLQYDAYTSGPDQVIKIGDPNRTVSGAQRYVISYTVQGALNRFSDHDELFWNVDGDRWPVAKESVTATVTTPAGAWTELACYQGPSGSREACPTTALNNFITFSSTRRLVEGEQMSIAVSLVKGAVNVPPPLLTARDREFPQDAFDINPLTVGLSLLILLGGIAAVAWNWWTRGRDRAYLGHYYEAPATAPDQPEPLFQHEPVVVEFGPPENLKPAQLGLILDESADPKDVTATIVDLAVRGYLTITDVPKIFGFHDWLLTQKPGDVTKLLPYERTLHYGLFAGREQVKVSELKGKFRSTMQEAAGQIVSDAMSRRFFTVKPENARLFWTGLGWATLIAGGFATYQLGIHFGWGLFGAAILLLGLVLILTAQVMSQRTARGRAVLQKTLGFRLYMNTAEKYRQQFAEKAEIFTQLLPYAIVFGVVDRWAKAFEGIDTSASNGWYVGNAPFQAALLSSSLQSMNSNISSAISAAPPSSGSGSGFGGGGGSGGGGGGGGGGSW
ncbi:MAG TPA: DUF2207 domain-containing protein [Candidatus Dormibacteraeota bacterium]|nr:DUF2207 domain-containing protein [Candidatus Dormibacteraeota bacterium]